MSTEKQTKDETLQRLKWASEIAEAHKLRKTHEAVLVEITMLADHVTGICWPNQQELAYALDIHRSSVSSAISHFYRCNIVQRGTRSEMYRYYYVTGAPSWTLDVSEQMIEGRAICDNGSREIARRVARFRATLPAQAQTEGRAICTTHACGGGVVVGGSLSLPVPPSRGNPPTTPPATASQISYVNRLLRDKGLEWPEVQEQWPEVEAHSEAPPASVEELLIWDASKVIDWLKGQPKPSKEKISAREYIRRYGFGGRT